MEAWISERKQKRYYVCAGGGGDGIEGPDGERERTSEDNWN